ncbi:MAG: DUF883 family protein [Sulfuricella sp.]|nr:DUF883 family protein [Sulfuricella sp.]
MEHITKGKLMEDLRMVVADAEELLKATANQTGERIAAACVVLGAGIPQVAVFDTAFYANLPEVART